MRSWTLLCYFLKSSVVSHFSYYFSFHFVFYFRLVVIIPICHVTIFQVIPWSCLDGCLNILNDQLSFKSTSSRSCSYDDANTTTNMILVTTINNTKGIMIISIILFSSLSLFKVYTYFFILISLGIRIILIVLDKNIRIA